MLRRRNVVAALAAAAGSAALPGSAATVDGAAATARQPLRVLILGGTRFIGRHMAEYALARGHTLTLFNRGKTNPGLFPGVEKLQGDRNGDLRSLAGRDWDVVLDTSGYVPRQVRDSATALAPHLKHYLFISSISVYASWERSNDEQSPVAVLDDPATEVVSNGSYGPLKALCEAAVSAVLPGRCTVVRPGFVVGPDDPTDRFSYWPVRVSRGGEMLAPGTAADYLQFIDVRDLARWCVQCVEQRTVGTFNAVHPPHFATIGAVLDLSRRQTGSKLNLTWVDSEFLQANDADIPIWAPQSGATAGLALTQDLRARRAGLRTTPLADTVHDTLAWWNARPPAQRKLQAGLSAQREAELLKLWKARRGQYDGHSPGRKN